MWRFAKRLRRPLSEGVCYARLYGERSDAVELLSREKPGAGGDSTPRPPSAPPSGPTSHEPALHLVFPFKRHTGSLSGEDLRLDLLARMRERRTPERPDDARHRPD